MSMFSALRPLWASRTRREVLLAVTAAYMLVQLSSLPVAISIPTLAEKFAHRVLAGELASGL